MLGSFIVWVFWSSDSVNVSAIDLLKEGSSTTASTGGSFFDCGFLKTARRHSMEAGVDYKATSSLSALPKVCIPQRFDACTPNNCCVPESHPQPNARRIQNGRREAKEHPKDRY